MDPLISKASLLFLLDGPTDIVTLKSFCQNQFFIGILVVPPVSESQTVGKNNNGSVGNNNNGNNNNNNNNYFHYFDYYFYVSQQFIT